MHWLFNAVYLIACVLAAPWLVLRAFRTGRYRHGWAEKFLGAAPRSDDQPTVWLHGVSVGEVQLLKPIADKIEERFPNHRIVISTTTVTGMQLARKLFVQHTTFYFPLDFSWAVKRALKRVNPQLIVLGELEIWPNLITLAERQNIPVVVINGRLSDKSYRGYSRWAAIVRPIFAKLHMVLAQNETYAARFRDLGVPAERVCVTGSTKFDNVTLDRHAEQVARLQTLVGLKSQHRVIVLGSSQAPEEAYMLRAFEAHFQNDPDLRLVVVPRHAERFEQVFQMLRKSPLAVRRRSEIAESIAADQWQIMLVDTIGELRWWWGLAEVAVVGGSFGTRGGQNMIEPAAYGCNVAFGPHTWNFREVVNCLVTNDAVTVLDDLDHLHRWIQDQLRSPELGRERGDRARQAIRQHQGATQRTIQQLENLLATKRHQYNRSAA